MGWGGHGHGHGGGGGPTQFFQEDEILGKAYDRALARRLAGYLAPYRRQMAVSVALMLAMSAAQVAPPLLTKLIIDQAIVPAASGEIAGDEGLSRLVAFGAAYLGLLLAGAALRYGQSVLNAAIGQRAMRDLRVDLYRHLESLSLSFFDHNPVGRLMTRVTNDIDALTDLVQRGVVNVFTDVALLVLVIGSMALLDWRLAAVALLALPAIVVVTSSLRRAQRLSFREVRLRLARINAYLNENINGMSIVQLFNRQRRQRETFEGLNASLLRANEAQVATMAYFQPVVIVTKQVTNAIILSIGALLILRGEMTAGTLIAFWQLMDRFFQPIQDLSEVYGLLQSAMASAERVFRLMDTPATIVDPAQPAALGHVRGAVTFEHVWFAYDHEEWVLRDVDFAIGAGESVALVGATGAGKTSIISLLSRFYDVQRGRILLDGVDIRTLRQAELRRHVGVVLQDPFIFAGTIAQNIRLNDTGISDVQVRAAARFVNADAFVERLPQGYDTPVTERGQTLSVGQKQLIAFARAIAFNPEILLVLDEATSSVDTETERLVQSALARLMAGRTSIIIAHRLSTIQNVDRIIVLHKGRVAEVGSHRDLLARRGVYHRLYELQYRPNEVAGA